MNNSVNKGVVVAVILLFIGVSCIPTGITSKVAPIDDIQKEPHGFFFGLRGHIMFDFNLDDFLEPIKPFGTYFVPFNVSYKVSGIFADIITRWFIGWTHMPVELSIKEVPEWAEITVSDDIVHCEISTDWKRCEECPYIRITIDHRAPAFELSYYKIVGASICVKGSFGFFNWIHGSEGEEEFPFVPDYLPLIHVTPETTYLEIPPGQMGKLNIPIENLGNGLTLVKSEIIEIPSPDWWVYIQPETVLDVGEEKEASLFIMPPENFTGFELIHLTFTPCYYYDPDNPELQGNPYPITIAVRCKP